MNWISTQDKTILHTSSQKDTYMRGLETIYKANENKIIIKIIRSLKYKNKV